MLAHQATDVELAVGVEAAVTVGDVLAQQAIGADRRLLAAHGGSGGVVDHQQMVADLVEGVLVDRLDRPIRCNIGFLGKKWNNIFYKYSP